MQRQPGTFSQLFATTQEQLDQDASFEAFQGLYPLLLGLFEEDPAAFEDQVLPLLRQNLPRFSSNLRGDYEGMILDLLYGKLPLSILEIVSTLQMGPALVRHQNELGAWLKNYPEDGPTIEGVRWRMPEGHQPRELSWSYLREPALQSPLLRELRVFDASQRDAFVSVFRERAQMHVSGDDMALGFLLRNVVECSPVLEVVNLYGEVDDGDLPSTWRKGKHRLCKVLRAVNLGGAEPLGFSEARNLVTHTAVEALYAKAGSIASMWECEEDEEPFVPDPEWTSQQGRSIANHLQTLEYGYTGSSPRYEPFGPTDWETHFGANSTPHQPRPVDQTPPLPELVVPKRKAKAQWKDMEALLSAYSGPFENADSQNAWTAQVRWLLQEISTQNPEEYQTHWLPSMAQHPHIWAQTALHCVEGADALAHWATLAPFAFFEVIVYGEKAELQALANSPHLPRVLSLEVEAYLRMPDALMKELLGSTLSALHTFKMMPELSPEALTTAAASPHLKALKTLQVRLPRDHGVPTLAKSTTLSDLRELSLPTISPEDTSHLHQNFQTLESLHIDALDGPGARALAQSSGFPALSKLSLSWEDEDLEPLSEWLTSSSTSNITTLELQCLTAEADLLGVRASLPSLAHLSVQTHYTALPEAPLLQETPALRSLELTCSSKASAPALAQCPHLSHIQRLHLNNNKIGFKGIAQILASPHLGELQSLHFDTSNHSPKASTEALAKLQSFPPKLRELHLPDNQLNPDNLGGLLQCQGLQQLAALNLFNNKLAPEGAKMLAQCPHLDGLSDLSLSQTDILAAGARALSRSHSLTRLKKLDLSSCKIEDKGLNLLLKADITAGLKTLKLANNSLTDKAARALAKCEHLSELEHLDLSYNAITEKGLKALAKSPNLTRLRSLNLWSNHFEKEGAGADILFHSTTLPWSVRFPWARWNS